MNTEQKSLKEKIVDVVCDVASEEMGVPRKEITADTELPLKAGMMIAMRMANAIPGGGGLIGITPANNRILCTIDVIAKECADEMERRIKLFEKLGNQ